MPLPDPHAGEMTTEINSDLWKQYEEALVTLKEWTEYVTKLKQMILAQLDDAYAGTVNGEKVVAHRPKDQYAISRLRQDYPDLTERFLKWHTEEIFNEEAFVAAHPEIADKYRVRAFVKLG